MIMMCRLIPALRSWMVGSFAKYPLNVCWDMCGDSTSCPIHFSLRSDTILRTVMHHPCVTGAARKLQPISRLLIFREKELVLPDRIELSYTWA